MRLVGFLVAIGIATPGYAEVVSSSPTGFEVRETVPLAAAPNAAFAAFTQIGAWWDPQHTYSGDSANLSLTLAPGGCFCERLPRSGGGIEHLRIIYLEPGKHIIFAGALGPLLYEAVNGVMDVEVKTTAGGSQLGLDYKVSGFANGGAEKLAVAVDQVLSAQMKRFRTYVAAQPKS